MDNQRVTEEQAKELIKRAYVESENLGISVAMTLRLLLIMIMRVKKLLTLQNMVT